ncbi:MAG: HDIG domain-containing protein [Bacteroidales bacterium]|nr:HDIG domain-containing protein [Bacteroidales bacterium]
MQRSTLPKASWIYFTLAVLWVVLMLTMPRTGKFSYDYRKGSPWTYETLVAQFDFPILKTQEQILEESENAGSSVIPYYKYSNEIAQSSLAAAGSLPLDGQNNLRQMVVTSLNEIYSKGIVSDYTPEGSQGSIIFVQRDKRTAKTLYSEVFTLPTAKASMLAAAAKAFPGTNVDSVLVENHIYDLLVPNLLYDQETTELVHAENVDYISPTMGFVNSGQLIVSKGELVTAEICQMLDSYKEEYENSLGYSGPVAVLIAGNAILALAIVLILFFVILYTSPGVYASARHFFYMVFVFLLASVGAMVMEKTNPNALCMIPFTLTALYLITFFRKRVVLPVYVISLIPLLVFSHNGVALFVMFVSAGVITIYVYQFLNKGWRQFVMAFISFVVLSVVYAGFCMIKGTNVFADMSTIAYIALGSLLSVAGYPLTFLFEKVFSLVSVNRLLELCDTSNNKLIKDLSQKAPGTFQHCLQVMNMVESVATEIGADSVLAKTGALYHDIGKMNNPLCFIENEKAGFSYHAGLSNKESARDITKHVTDGVDIAIENSLPEVVINFILSHHGTSSTGFFYNKYLNEGGDPDDVKDFFYQGRKPQTKEEAIVMLCDTIEAASRTLKDNRPETFSSFVDGIVASKMKDGQLSESELTLKELEVVKTKLKSYLEQLYHDRIAYPKRNA